MLIDQAAREQATDPTQSFIVQAPAGSGKTEILTQRYLRLLATVDAPEQIIALTFTRKAANEMRERILLALKQAAAHSQATTPHQQRTLSFAQAALARDQLFGWHLLKQSSRLRVTTIDALCQQLTQSIPLSEQDIHYATPTDKPATLYQEAAKNCLRYLTTTPTHHSALYTLLSHLDNQQDDLLRLFADLLAKREQWIDVLYQARNQDQSQFEQALAWIEAHELSRFKQTLSCEMTANLINCIQQLAQIVPDRQALLGFSSLNQLDANVAAALADTLLTKQNTLRKSFDHHVGLKRGNCPNDVYDALKASSKTLLNLLDLQPDFLAALIRIRRLPKPTYDETQWAVLEALFKILPLLLAHLTLTFQAHHQVDFTTISQHALQALGDEQTPTDLALYLDHRIQHLLIDEFQDTSIHQFQFVSQLVQGFEPDDGRTLFVVGDPMQSIYRFRSAEVGLFLRAKTHGIGPVRLHSLTLHCNFRSSSSLVDWVNTHFTHIFPYTDDIEAGAVSFLPSQPIHTTQPSAVIATQYPDSQQQAEGVISTILEELSANPTQTIAILVRSRRQLKDIIRALRAHQIPFQGVDIELLSHLPHLRDVWILTQTLLMPGHRLAWIACLRAPWCGLSLSDLHAIATFEPSKSVYQALSQLDRITQLSPTGRARAQFVFHILCDAITHRHQQRLSEWLITTLQQLNYFECIDAIQQQDLEQYWQLIDQFECAGQLTDWALFKHEFETLYSKKTTPSRVQLMTIHKSKGLEFDCVILPGLGSKSNALDRPFFRWLKLPKHDEQTLFLLSPLKAAHQESDKLYDYLTSLEAEKEAYEQQRLLYVAVTRAKKRLYLYDSKQTVQEGSFRSLLATQPFLEVDTSIDHEANSPTMPELWHLPQSDYPFDHPNTKPNIRPSSTYDWQQTPHARWLGIVTHELLQWICTHHPDNLEHIPWSLAWQSLQRYGFIGDDLAQAKTKITRQIKQMLCDPIGQWITQKHLEEKNEYELLVHQHHQLTTQIIDRTFIENHCRWIIDFKTGEPDKQHTHQLNRYAQLFSDVTIRCGLYYLDSNQWIHWQPDPTTIDPHLSLSLSD